VEATTESAQQQVDYRLGTSGRYGHSRRYLAQGLAAAGFAILRSDDIVLRSEFCKPIQGIGVLARVLPR
jgi:predicted TPR repeat methyltransferase